MSPTPHDALAKTLFSMPQVVRDLLLGFVPCESLHRLDFSTLESAASPSVTVDMRQRFGDSLWRIRCDGEWTYIYLLLEFQSTPNGAMAIRMAQYVSLLLQHLSDGKEFGRLLPPVMPLVVYNGDRPWRAKCELSDLMAPVHEDLAPFQMRLRYFVLDMGRCDPAAMAEMRNLVAYAVQIEHATCPEATAAAMHRVRELIGDDVKLSRAITDWTRGVLAHRTDGKITVSDLCNLEDLPMAIAPGYQRWLDENSRESRLEGRQEGRQEGSRELLREQLEYRFDRLPDTILARIEGASDAELKTWGKQLLRAETLEEVFRAA